MTNADRRHDLDWLRLIAILILLFYHTGMLFNPWDWHIKNDETSVGFTINPVRLFFGMKPRAAIPEKKEAALRPLPADSDRT